MGFSAILCIILKVLIVITIFAIGFGKFSPVLLRYYFKQTTDVRNKFLRLLLSDQHSKYTKKKYVISSNTEHRNKHNINANNNIFYILKVMFLQLSTHFLCTFTSNQ